MKLLSKFLRLSSDERNLLFSAVLLLLTTRFGLWLIPFQRLRRFIRWLSRAPKGPGESGKVSSNQVAWAIQAASRYIPLPMTCLTKALAAKILLSRHDLGGRLCIGVAKDEEGLLKAHAWISDQDVILVGNLPDLSSYTVLPDLPNVGMARTRIGAFFKRNPG